MKLVSDRRISRDNGDIRKVLWFLKQVSSLVEDNSLIGSIATSVIGYEVEKMAGKDIFQYNLNRSEKVKTLPITTSVKLSSKDEATFFLAYHFKS